MEDFKPHFLIIYPMTSKINHSNNLDTTNFKNVLRNWKFQSSLATLY